MRLVGLISDTHGLLRPEALAALARVEHIVHAGDVGNAGVLDALRALAPVTAVRGNNDHGPWADALPEAARVAFGATRLLVLHEIARLEALAIAPRAEGLGIVVYGHSHRPAVERRDGVLHVNPGSAGPRRFKLPVTVARLMLDDAGGEPAVRIVELPLGAATSARRRSSAAG